MAKRPRMVALGAICTTAIFQVERIESAPAKVMASQRCTVVDGMAVSAACAFQKLGGQAQVWARVGEDAEAHAMRQALAQEGVDAQGLHTVPGARSSHAAVIVDAQGQRLVVPFHDPQVDTSPDWLPLHELAQTDLLHCDVRWPEGALAALHAARQRGVRTMVDGDVAPQAVLQSLMPLADYAVFSDAGLRAYTGLHDVQEALLQVAQKHSLHVGASCGEDGYYWVQDGAIAHAPALAIRAVDTLAAGDVFHGALALAILEGQTMAQAARFACVAASLKCTQFGGRLGCPSRDEVLQALR
ncbi:MAG: ribokinase [Comamonadaceae bacterium PBBC2]|nr:MAG: ribokinase [Comamonadaceae bacterium PBBC2]